MHDDDTLDLDTTIDPIEEARWWSEQAVLDAIEAQQDNK